ncbi:MAG: CubicO group peptidase (beta-lactamase class C family) [Flavobacteriales bacterium]|jgi:CubicO group peptidase (beta-lactamase class C family)
MKQFSLLFTIAFVLLSIAGNTQVSENSDLFIQLKKTDSLFFEEGFNKCNFEILETYIPEDFEFYHDQNGSQNREQFFTAFRESICSNTERKPIRKVVEGSLEVFRLKNNGQTYGAIQNGIHLFYIQEPNKEIYLTNIAKFTSVWNLENDEWKLSRVLSYDHKEPNKNYGQRFDANSPMPLFASDPKIENLLEQHNIPSIAIGYIEDGKLAQLRSFGNQKDDSPASINSIYKVASLTKPIAALVALKLIENGDLALDEPIAKYYVDPDLKDHPHLNKLTARHILSQQSGFPNWRYLNDSNKLTFEFEPGTKFQYSGEGFEYLRKAIEGKIEQSLEDIAQELLFAPLGMTDTYFYWTPEVDEVDYAVEHDEDGNPIDFEKYYEANAAANLLTTASDYSKFLIHIMNGAGLSDSLFSEFLKPQVNEKSGIERNLGMQLLTNLPNSETALMHTGGDYGTKAIAITLLNARKGLVLFSNSENGMVLWQKIISEYFGETGTEIVRRNLE